MKKILIYSMLLFWWCLMFPSNSYIADSSDVSTSSTIKPIIVGDKELRLKILDIFTN